jgi:hypothetical protein
MKKNKMAIYAPFLSNVINDTNKIGEEMSKDYEPLEAAIEKDDYSSVDLKSTKLVFQNGTDRYRELLNQLDKADVPARELGRHAMLKDAYTDYVKGCQDMVDSIQNTTVAKDDFNAAGDLQQSSIEKVFKIAQKILMTM